MTSSTLDPTFVDVDLDLSGWACGPLPPSTGCSVGYPQVINLRKTAGRTQPVDEDLTHGWIEATGPLTNGWTSGWSWWSTTVTGTPPDEVTTRNGGSGGSSGTATYAATAVRNIGYHYHSDFSLTENEVKDLLIGLLPIAGNGVNALEHEIDTAASLTHASTHPIKIHLKYDYTSNSVTNIRRDSELKQQALESYWYPIPGDNSRSNVEVEEPTMTLYIDSYQVKRIRDNSPAASSSNRHTLNHSNDNVLLDDDDGRTYSGPTVNAYEWDINWRFEISENLSGYYDSYANSSRGYSNSSGDSENGNSSFLSNHLVWGGYSRQPLSSGNNIEYTGTYKTATCTLVVQAPTCTLSVNRGPFHSNNGNFVPETEAFDSGRDKHLGNSYLNSRDVIVFPVGQQGVSRTKLRTRNYNPFQVETNSANYPEYEIETQSLAEGSRFPTDGFYPKSVRTQDQPVAHVYNAFDPANKGIPASYNNTVSYIPERRPYLNNGIDNSLNFPGEYLTTWTLNWQSLANGATWTHNPPAINWRGGEIASDECNTKDARHRIKGYTYMFAEPPTCEVEYTVFDVNNDQTRVEVKLTNPNNAPMKIDRFDYEINRALSSILANQTGSLPLHAIPAADDLYNDNFIIGQTPRLAIQRPDNGIYDFNWTLRTSMGNERWTSLDDSTDQNSWFEDPDERILGYLPDGTATVDDECREKMRVLIRPYVKLFYGDLAVGGYFGRAREYDACSNDQIIGGNTPVGHLAGHAEIYHSQHIGSSTSYGIGVHDAVIGFNSANGRSVWPSPEKGLTLGNVNNLNQLTYPDHAQWGGQFGRPRCIANYWRGAEGVEDQYISHGSSLAVDLQTLNNNERRRYDLTPGQRLNINDGSASNTANLKATIYANGDIHIQNNIINGENTIWNTPADIGVITIIAKGNIYIAPHVTRIDAVLIAYPNEVAGQAVDGEIWTCYGFTTSPGLEHEGHFRYCTEQLVINGALIAQKIRLGRIHGSVKEGTSQQIRNSKLFQRSDYFEQLAERHYSDLYTTLNVAEIGYLIEEKVLPGDSTQPESRPGNPLGDQLGPPWGGPADNEDCSKYSTYQPTPVTSKLRFCPEGDYNGLSDYHTAVTPRWQVAVWLARALNKGRDPIVSSTHDESSFPDVSTVPSDPEWAEWAPHVAYLEQRLGIGHLCENPNPNSSCTPTDFHPDHIATRLWLAVLIKEAFNVPDSSPPTYFIDLNTYIPPHSFAIDSYHVGAIEDIYAAGITHGCAGTPFSFCPADSVRHELAALLARAMAWQEVRTNTGAVAASEIINLLPEYWLAAPELPFFEEQLQKSDSFTYDPVNF